MRSNVALPLSALVVVVGAMGIGLFATERRNQGAEAGRSAAVSPADPRVTGDQLIFDPSSPQLGALAAAPVVDVAATPLQLSGRLAWNEDVTVRVFSPFAGRVVDVRVDVGRRVATGDVLATVAAPDFGQAQADTRRAMTDLALAERTLARQRDLLVHGVVAQKDVDAAEADAVRAHAEAERARARLTLYGSDSMTVTQVFALRAPIAGVVVARAINAGQEVRPDQMLANAPQLFAPLFVVTDPSRLWVQLDLNERDVPALAVDAPLELRTQAWPDRAFRGRLSLIGSDVDPTTRTVKARGTIDNPDGQLKAEMLVTATAEAARPRLLAVPASAVLLDGDSHVVFVEEQRGRYRRRAVKVGEAQGDLVPVLEGLRPGDRVVTGSALLLEQLYQDASSS